VTIQGNLIGTDASGTFGVPNASHGVLAESRCVFDPPRSLCSRATIGGPQAEDGNVIAFNLGSGIVAIGDPNIRSNRVHSNAGLGIDLGSSGQGSSGYPILNAAASSGGSTVVLGTMPGQPNATWTMEFFANSECDPSGYGEGETLMGSVSVQTNAEGSFSVVFDVTLPLGSFVTSTAPTSEFSACRTVTDVFPLQVLDTVPASGVASGGTPVTLSGSGFLPGMSVTIGGVPASNVVAVDPFHITAVTPVLPPGTLNDIAVATSAPLVSRWMADFLDVPDNDIHHGNVETVFRGRIAVGCATGYFCRDTPVRRDQMAVFLQKIKHGPEFVPPPCTPPGRFLDVACPGPFTDWIEQFAYEGNTAGCGGGNYCPADPVRRDQMAVFLLKVLHGWWYVPEGCMGVFHDVPCTSPFAPWIETLAQRGVTAGCGGGNYCPGSPSTRAQMATFLVNTFDLE
jgi:hypothetical protein